ncbi:MAG: putative transporter ATP-binding protein [Candidatus Saccharibacteria bacterium]|jgi:ATP-binding cassette subfamily B protein|nr:putative transporter ATP-binding protein [Candidatus Saccharibacteria bacterium]
MPKLLNRTDPKIARKTLAIYWQEIRKNKKLFFLYTILILLNRFLYIVALPLLFSLIIQSLITEPHNWQHASTLLLIAAIISVASVITSTIGFRRLFYHEEHIQTTLLERAMLSLSSHSEQFFANHKVGSLAGDVSKFAHSIISIMDVVYLQASGLIVNYVTSLIVIAILSPILLLPLTLVTGVLIWRSVVGTGKRGPIRHRRKLMTSKLNGLIADIIGNQQIVRAFATEQREIHHVTQGRHDIEKVVQQEIDVIEKEGQLRQSTLFAFQIITMAFCIWLYTTDGISIAGLIFAVTYFGRLTGSLFDISPIIRGVEQAFLDAADITEVLSITPEVKDKKHAQTLAIHEGAVRLENVSFEYPGNTQAVINDLSVEIQAGERIGLAGYSGGGKTTLTKLILRFADVSKGTVTIDGKDIRDISQQSLRANIAYVPQEPYLFHRSLRDNIAYGKPDASDGEIMIAVKQANALQFIETLPEGLDTIVGERGVKLSGGQRQRIAIARAILKDAPILILDEATSALDSESEKLIQDALEKLMKNRTSIVIAHRLSTIAKLDRIIVLEQGTITENGTHAELLEQKGIYANLWSHQSGGFIEK